MTVTYGLTDAGFNPKTADVIEAELLADFRSVEGLEDIQADPSDPWGQVIAILTEREALLWLLLLLIWQSGFRDSATGMSLDHVVALLGKSRFDERRSTVTLRLYNRTATSPVLVEADNQARQGATGVVWELLEDAQIPALTTLHTGLAVGAITWQSGNVIQATLPAATDLSAVDIGDEITLSGCTNSSNDGTFVVYDVDDAGDWIEYTNPNRSDDTDDEAASPGQATILDTETFVDATAQSYSAGAFEASPGSINQIVTSVSGWDAVTNPYDALVGREREGDTPLRRRVAGETVSAKGGTLEAVVQAVANLPGVTYVAGIENDTGEVVDGLKKNSIQLTVVGGEHQEIVDTIGRVKGGGISTNGTEAGTWINGSNQPITIYYSRVDELLPYIELILTVDSTWPTDPVAQNTEKEKARAAVVALPWTHGQDLLNYRLIVAAGSAGVQGLTEIQALQSWTAGPTDPDNLVVSATEVVNITADRVTVTVVT